MRPAFLPSALALVVISLPCAAQPAASGTPGSAASNHWAALFSTGNATRFYAEKAAETGDKEVLAAAVYNELHLAAMSTNTTHANAALRRLETEGDEFTLTWLETMGKNETLAARRAQFETTRERIRQRLAKSQVPAERLVRERLMNAALSDLTCSALEGPLKGFMWKWSQTNATQPAVRAELKKLQAEPVNTNNPTAPDYIRQRANWYATRLLEPLPAPEKASEKK